MNRKNSEREGFEPSVPFTEYASLAGTCLQPLSHLSIKENDVFYLRLGFSASSIIDTSLQDKILLRKRSLIETVNDQLKNISQIEHTRHRSPQNFLINLLGGIAAYGLQPKKPSLQLDDFKDFGLLAVA